MRFDGKVVVVTGAGSGMGLASARRFAEEGGSVVLVGRNLQALDEAAAGVGGKVEVAVADVGDLASLDRLFAGIRESHGRVDVLHVNAGVGRLRPVAEMPPEDFDEVIGVNFRGAYFAVQKALPLSPDGGVIVVTTSWLGEVGVAGASVVSASKAAARSLVRTLAAELVERNIRVNGVRPGVMDTGFIAKAGLSPDAAEGLAASLRGTIPMKRFGRAEEVASAVAFLASDEASYITGIDLPVDGGLTEL